MPVEVPPQSESAVRESIGRELKIVRSKLERYRDTLEQFEDEYGMNTEEFVAKFERGELGDDEHWFEWKFAHNAYEHLREKEEQLKAV